MDRQYAAFISYRHAKPDSAVARQLHSMIEQYRIPRELRKESNRLGIVFRDEEELHAASDLSSEITAALNNAEHLIVVCSENTAQSPWVSREIETFLKNHDRSRIFTVLASGEPQDVFPHQLTHIPNETDGSVQLVEPLAVDVRAGSVSAMRRKLRRELPRLISSMLDLPYDVLVMREQKRKQRRIAAVSAAAMAVVLSFSTMVLLKNREIQQRNDEIEYQNQEIQQRNEEIEHQNRELARQKAEVQLRESQLLTQDAAEAMESGDYRTAIASAAAALPKPGSDDRPYYAPAETCLMDAMNVFGIKEAPVVLATRVLEQMTPIREFRISEDGSRVVTMDEYGGVRCFSSETGSLLWSTTVTGSGDEQNENLLLLPAKVLCFYRSRVEAFDPETGASLWQQDLPHCIPNYMFHDPAQDTLVFLEAVPDASYNYTYRLLCISGTTGEPLKSIPLDPPPGDPAGFINTYYSEYYALGGAFSEDGSLFAGAVFNGSFVLHCFVADLEQGTARIIYRHDAPGNSIANITGLTFRDSDSALLLTAHNLQEDAASVLKIDCTSGKLLWQSDIFGKDGSFSFLKDTSCVHIARKILLVGFYDHIYLVDGNTGDVLSEKQLPGIVTKVQGVSDSTFGYSLESGICGVGWLTINYDIRLSSEVDFQVYASIPEHQNLQIWGGGIVQYYNDGNRVDISVSNNVSPGYVALIPTGTDHEIHVLQPVRIPSAVERTTLSFPNLTLAADSGCTVQPSTDRLVLGPMRTKGTYNTTYVILDRETLAPLYHWITQDYMSTTKVFWLPDTFTRLTDDSYANVILTGLNDRTTVLASDENRLVEIGGTWYSTYKLLRSDSAYQSDGSHILSAATTPDSMSVWIDGAGKRTFPLPDALQCTPEEYWDYTRLILVSPTGYVLVTRHPDPGFPTTDCTMIYDTARDSWQRLPQGHTLPNTRAIAFSPESPLLAVVDDTETLRLYDLSGNTPERTFSIGIPADSVQLMTFLPEDSCLAVLTEDGKLLIYDLTDGTILYRDQLPNAYGGTLHTWLDKANRRLYIGTGVFNSPDDGICVDPDSWTRLSYVPGLVWFDEEAGLLYQYNKSYSDPAILFAAIPGTAELVELGQAIP